MEKLKSRKLWAMVLGVVLTTLNGALNLVPDTQMQMENIKRSLSPPVYIKWSSF